MKIAFLTHRYSEVLNFLCASSWSRNLTIINFSSDGRLERIKDAFNINYIRFASWERLRIDLQQTDLLISYKLNRIIPESIISSSRYGGINIHPSLLPHYPGINPWFEMYYNMELKGGVTIHKLTERPDAGNILIQSPFDIEKGEPLAVAMENAENTAIRLLGEVLNNDLYLQEGSAQTPLPQNPSPSIDYDTLMNFETGRLWHLLRGFPKLIYHLFPELEHSFYEVGEYVEANTGHDSRGIVIRNDGRPFICCKDGYISLYDFSRMPMASDYISAIENGAIVSPQIIGAEFERNIDGCYRYLQGREAIVFPIHINGRKKALRFLKNISTDKIEPYIERLTATAQYLSGNNITHFARFEVLPSAINTPKGHMPAIMMDWDDGESLSEYINHHLGDKEALSRLADEFIRICSTNHLHGIVHGDIHPGNIHIDSNGKIILLDIDHLWIQSSRPVKDYGGNRNYQHPLRKDNKYLLKEADYFSELIIYANIYIALKSPELYSELCTDGNIFTENDYISPESSPVMKRLEENKDFAILHHQIQKACQSTDLREISPLEQIFYPLNIT